MRTNRHLAALALHTLLAFTIGMFLHIRPAMAETGRGQNSRQLPSGFAFVVVAVGLLCFLFPANAADQAPIPVVLENENLRIEVDPGNGVISRVSDKQGQIHVAPVVGLADNFRLVLRGADKKDRVILGRGQKLSEVSKTGNVLDLAWNQPLADKEGGTHNVRVRMKIRLAGESLEFRIYLQNESEYKVTAVWYPLIGGLTGFGRGQAKDEVAVHCMKLALRDFGISAIPLAWMWNSSSRMSPKVT